MTRPSTIRILALLAVTPAWLAPALAGNVPLPDDAREYVQQRLDAGLGSGVAIGLVSPKGVSYYNFGTLERDGEKQVSESTLFEIGSITKAFTCTLLMEMVQRGEVGLDDPIQKYLPKKITAPIRNGKSITLRDLATHHSGLPRLPTGFAPKDPTDPYADISAERLFESLAKTTLARNIGEKYEYSNFGVGLLGELLARAAGQPYEKLIVERVCKPLEMNRTSIKLTDKQQRRMATGYQGQKPAKPWNLNAVAGAGGLKSSTHDMLRFVAAAMGQLETPLADALRAAWRERRPTGADAMQIAFGWHVLSRHNAEIVWHNGGTGGFRSFCGFLPESKLGVVVLTNSTQSIDELGLHLLESQYALPEIQQAAAIDSKTLDDYLGHYELAPGAVFEITREGDQLMARLTGQSSIAIFPKTPDEFFYRAVDAQITFVRNDAGEVEKLILHQAGMDRPARKLGPEYQPPRHVEIPVDPKTLPDYVGKYELVPGVIADVQAEKDELWVQLTGQPRFRVYPEAADKFFYKVVEAVITFERDADGKVQALTLFQGGVERRAPRMADE